MRSSLTVPALTLSGRAWSQCDKTVAFSKVELVEARLRQRSDCAHGVPRPYHCRTPHLSGRSFASAHLADGDRLEIVVAVGGRVGFLHGPTHSSSPDGLHVASVGGHRQAPGFRADARPSRPVARRSRRSPSAAPTSVRTRASGTCSTRYRPRVTRACRYAPARRASLSVPGGR